MAKTRAGNSKKARLRGLLRLGREIRKGEGRMERCKRSRQIDVMGETEQPRRQAGRADKRQEVWDNVVPDGETHGKQVEKIINDDR